MSDWIWVAVMPMMWLFGFIVGTTVRTSNWSGPAQAWWWGFTHPFGPPPPWWPEPQREEWLESNGKPWEQS